MSRRDLVIGLDVGSGSAKATVFDLDGGKIAEGQVPYKPRIDASGIAEYDPSDLMDGAVKALARAVKEADASEIRAIGVDAMMSGALAVDERGEALTPYTTTLDTRFGRHVGEFLEQAGPRLRRSTGSGQPTLAPKIAWMVSRDPGLSSAVAKFTLAGDLVVRHLSGDGPEAAFIDRTYLWTTGLADVQAGTWDEALCRLVPVDTSRLPRIVAPTEVIGGVRPDVARVTGIKVGTPIVAGCGDQAAGYIGAGVADPTMSADSAGTYSVFAAVTSVFQPSVDPAGPDLVASAVRGRYHPQAVVIGGGLTRDWAAGLFRDVDAADLEAAAAASPIGAHSVIFVPYLGGRAHPPQPGLRGSWRGLTWSHTVGDLYRAVLESVALEHSASLARMRNDHPDVCPAVVRTYGGGSRSPLWNQIKADAIGLPYETLGDTSVTALGAAWIAAEGVGLITDAAEHATKLIRPLARYEPDDDGRHRYQAVLARYRQDVEDEVARAQRHGVYDA